MSKRSDQEHMDRLRAARGLPPQTRNNLMMERTRAAVCLINTGRVSEATKLAGFLAIFHPEIEPGSRQYIEMMQDVRSR